jgi:RHS repeat-associated protein
MPGMQFNPNDYGLDYQGQIKDTETGWNSFELRMYDGRIGRWLTTDPFGQHHSPYLGMSNNPISTIDPNGGYDYELYNSFQGNALDNWRMSNNGDVGGFYKGLNEAGFSLGDYERGYTLVTTAWKLTILATGDRARQNRTYRMENPAYSAAKQINNSNQNQNGSASNTSSQSGNSFGSKAGLTGAKSQGGGFGLQEGLNVVGAFASGFGALTDMVETAAELSAQVTYKYGATINGVRKSATTLAQENKSLMRNISSGARLAGNVLGVVSFADHVFQAHDAFSKGDNINGWINVGKSTVDLGLIIFKANPTVLGISVLYNAADASGKLKWNH